MVGKKKTPKTPSSSGLKLTSKSPFNRGGSTQSLDSDEDSSSQRITAKCPRLILPAYALNTQIICQYSDSYFYDGKIIKVDRDEKGEFLYTIHYNGWNSRYDEIISHAEAQTKFIQHTPENLVLAKREIAEARKRKSSKTTSTSTNKKVEKKSKKDGSLEKQLRSQTPTKSEKSRKDSTNHRHGSSTSRLESGGIDVSNNEADSEDDMRPIPYLAQIPKEKRNKIHFPRILDKVVMDDCDLVTRQYKLPKIPARVSIDDIINEYLLASQEPENTDDSKVRENISALIKFFNKLVNIRVLYKFEFVQHLDLLNEKRRNIGLPDLPIKDLMEQDDINGPDSPLSEENKDDPDVAFKPPTTKQSKSTEVTAEGENEKRQLRETRNKKPAAPAPEPIKVVAKPKKKEKVAKSENFEDENNFNFADSYGFVHFVRFFYHYNSLLKNKTIAKAIYTDHAELINDIIEFLSLRAKEYFKVEEDYEIATPAYQRQAFSH